MLRFRKIAYWLLYLSIPFIGVLHTAKAQQSATAPYIYFELFETPGGDLGNIVQSITQDSFGFMWFGSQYGLHRWDGQEFVTYLHIPNDSTTIASNYIEYIYVASNGDLWIGLWGKGLDRFDYEQETFEHYLPYLSEEEVFTSAIVEDKKGDLWIGSMGGLYHLDLESKTSKLYKTDPTDPNSLSANNCRVLLIDSQGILWVGTGFPWGRKPIGGLNRYQPETDQFIRYLNDPADPNSLSTNKVTSLFEDSNGNFWVGTVGDGLHLMDRETGKFTRLQRDSLEPNRLSGPFISNDVDRHIRFIFEDNSQKIWIGALPGSISTYDLVTEHITTFCVQENNAQCLPEASPWTLFQSSDGTYWGSTNGPEGVVFKLKMTGFSYYPLKNPNLRAFSFVEGNGHKVWVGTDWAGLLQFDRETNLIAPYLTESRNTNKVEFSDIWDNVFMDRILDYFLEITLDQEGYLWARKFSPAGLFRLDPITGNIKFYQHDPEESSSIGKGSVTDILKDEKGQIWAVTSEGELNRYDPREDDFIRFKIFSPPSLSGSSYYHFTLSTSDKGKIWVGGKGVNSNHSGPLIARFDPSTLKSDFLTASAVDDDPKLKYENIHGLFEDDLGNLWICSETQLKKINPATGENQIFGSEEFGTQYFKGLVQESRNRVWLTGEKISLFDLSTGLKKSFIPDFNLQPTDNFAQFAYLDTNGLLYFGGAGGFQILDPQRLVDKEASFPVETIISKVQILARTDTKQNRENQCLNILTSDQLSLNHTQNAFTFHFAALAFQHPASNRLEFKLEGYDNQWRKAGIPGIATYIKVPPGDYTFKVRGASLRSEWGKAKTIDLTIAYPWWLSWWAFACYAFLVFGLMYMVYKIRLRQKLDRAESQRLTELDLLKTQLYTNITHEFRTPLTVISGMAGLIKNDPQKWIDKGIVMIERNCKGLLDLVNRMLELSKLESGTVKLQLEQGDIISELKYIIDSIHSYAESKGIKVHFLTEKEKYVMDFDTKKIQQVLINLIFNSLKFTPPGGDIYIWVQKIEVNKGGNNQHDRLLQIKVKDTGKGIPENQLQLIFDHFYQVEDRTTTPVEGIGIGLALVKKLIHLMRGSISVKSELSKGTEFTILLPYTCKHKKRNPMVRRREIDFPTVTKARNRGFSILTKREKPEEKILDQKQRILIIEDHPDVVAYLISYLQDEYDIQVAKDGKEGIEIAYKQIPDLIISDVIMPLRDGFDVCRTLKNNELTSHIPIIMLTAKSDIESKLKGLEQGADAYLTKPFHEDELIVRIKKLLENRKKLQERFSSLAGFAGDGNETSFGDTEKTIDDQFIVKLGAVVGNNLDNFGFTVDKLAKELGMSTSQLHRKATALIGLSPNKFIRIKRLNKSKELLKNPDAYINEVAYNSGFNDPSYFSRVFKKEFGMTPMEWKTAHS